MTRYNTPLEAALGGGIDLGNIVGTVQMPLYRAAVTALSVDGLSKLRLPDATKISPGLNRFGVFNISPSQTLPILDFGNTELTVVPANGLVKFHLRENATSAGVWTVHGLDTSGAPNEDWFVQIGSRFWQMLNDNSMPIGTNSLTRYADLVPKSDPPTGMLEISVDGGGTQEVDLVQN